MLKATLVGNVGNDPEELRYNANGTPFIRFNVASNYRARTQEGEWQDKTEWVRVVASGKRAEFLSQYMRKGAKIYVDGRLEAGPWIDNQQQPRAGLTLLANANDVELMSSRTDDEGGGGPRPTDQYRQAPSAAPARASAPRSQPPASGEDSDLEDLPF